MGYLDEILNPQVNPIILHKRMLAENVKFQNEQVKDKMLNDPTAIDQVLSHLSRSAIPDNVAKRLPAGVNFEKAISSIDSGDPRRKILEQLQVDMPNIIKNTPYGVHPAETIMKTVQDRGTAAKEDIYKYIQSNSGMFGKNVAPEAGYDVWEQNNPGMTSPIATFAGGVASELASMPLLAYAAGGGKGAGLARLAGSALSFSLPGGMVTKLLSAGLMTAVGMAGVDMIKKASASAGHPLNTVEELIAGIPAFGGVHALAKSGGRTLEKSFQRLATPTSESALSYMGLKSDLEPTMKAGTFKGASSIDSTLFDASTKEGLSREQMRRGYQDIWKQEDFAVGTAEAKVRDAEIKAAKIAKFSEPTLEDLTRIQNGEPRDKVIAERLNANLSDEATAAKEAQDQLTKRKIGRAHV
jgi:hypothetical protein